MKITAPNSAHIINAQAKKERENKISCSICQDEIDLKISNFLRKALCFNCFFKELKLTFSKTISPKIKNSLLSLFQENKIFQPFNGIFNLNENTRIKLFNHICEIKHYRDFLQIDFEGLIKKILMENCLVCFIADVETCHPKNLIILPCKCTFYSLGHFGIFLMNLIKLNSEDKETPQFTCLCNAKYNVPDILKIFEIINVNTLNEEFHSIKNFLLHIYFKKFCCVCGHQFTPLYLQRKSSYFFRDNMIGMFLNITLFEHFACDECESSIKNLKSNLKKLNKPLVFPCNICTFEHLF